jgi:beta-lactamase superfamily II metal-dependent hydrolase
MSDKIQIREVKVELLRTGPSHNQLLSPLTQYLGICDGAEAGIVTVPFEHEAFLRRVKSMRYSGEDAKDRGPVLRDMGVEMAKVLGAVPRLPGSLGGDASGPDTLVHLRLVLSASELAVLPFELAKIPIGPAAWAEGWLSLQARVPVVITRRTRDVSATRIKWPLSPRILFIASDPETDGIPFEAHKQALFDAVKPYLKKRQEIAKVSSDGRREEYEDALTILKNASFDDVVRECAGQRYTHVHILAHGGEDRNVEETSYGLVLHPRPDVDDVISGERFASAFAALVGGTIHRPTVVTLATCDSGNAGSVLIPGASMAHALHQAGIPLVVASQFPLSMEGSDLVVKELYPGLLKGDHPLILLHRIRTDLHGRLSARSHDWASLVVYEALPPALEEQLEEVRYRQGMRAVWISFDQLDAAMIESSDQLPPERHKELASRVEQRADELPLDGPFRLECLGLRAGSYKRLAEAAFWAAMATRSEGERNNHLTHCCSYLEDALKDYEQAAKGFLLNQAAGVRPVASMHWVLGQLLCIAAVLGKPVRDGTWETARLSAETYIDDADMDGRGWAYASLTELWLLKLADTKLLDPKATDDKQGQKLRKEAEKQARHYATELIKLARSSKDPQIQATHAQFMRYVEWWSADRFEEEVARLGTRSTESASWKKLGIVRLAREIIGILEMRGPGKRSASAVSAVPAPLASPEPAKAVEQPPPAAPAPTGYLAATTKARPTTTANANGALFNIEMLPAGHGDCLWVEYGDGPKTNRVLIDCGTKSTYDAFLKARIGAQTKSARDFELFILTHIDDDHIGGGIQVLKEASSLGVTFADVWFNGWKHIRKYGNLNAKQGEIFSELTAKNELNWNVWKSGGAIVLPEDGTPQTCKLPGGLQLTLLSPTEQKLKELAPKWKKEIEALGKTAGEGGFLADVVTRSTDSTDVVALANARFDPDAAENNGSSIAVLAEYEGKSVLFGADAHAPLLVTTIRKLLKSRGKDKLKLDAFKLPHHGSQNNLSKELMELLDCRNYLVSSNGSTFKHPDREAIGRVIHYGGERPRLHFNYESKFNVVWKTSELQRKHNYETVYPADVKKPGLIVRL